MAHFLTVYSAGILNPSNSAARRLELGAILTLCLELRQVSLASKALTRISTFVRTCRSPFVYPRIQFAWFQLPDAHKCGGLGML